MVNYHGREWSLWYKQESAEGTPPTSTQYLALAQLAEVEIIQDPNPVAVAQSGSVDKTAYAKGVSDVRATVTFHPSGANGLAFVKNFASTDNSFALIAKAGSIFQVIAGCKIKNIEARGQLFETHGPMEVTCEIWGWTISGTEPTGATYESIPSSFVNWSDTAITLGGSSVTDWWDYTWRIENELFRMRDNIGTTTAIHRGTRDGTATIRRTVTDNVTADFNAAKDATSKAAVFNYVSSSAVFTFTGVFRSVAATHQITGMSGKRIDVAAATITIA